MIYSVQKLRRFRPVEAKNVSTSSATTSSLLAAVADLQITLDPTGVITHAESDSDLLELLPLSSVTGLSWLELIQSRRLGAMPKGSGGDDSAELLGVRGCGNRRDLFDRYGPPQRDKPQAATRQRPENTGARLLE